MVLNQLKQIRDELKNSADAYDLAFKNTAIIAAQELVDINCQNQDNQSQNILSPNDSNLDRPPSNPDLNKQYLLEKYGSLKKAKLAYQKKYGKQKYGRSWSEFIAVAKQLASSNVEQKELSLEERITKIEAFLRILGYQG